MVSVPDCRPAKAGAGSEKKSTTCVQLSPGSSSVASGSGQVESGCPGLKVSGTAASTDTDTDTGWELELAIVTLILVVEPKGCLPNLRSCGLTSSARPSATAPGGTVIESRTARNSKRF